MSSKNTLSGLDDFSLSDMIKEKLSVLEQAASGVVYFDGAKSLVHESEWKDEYYEKVLEHLAKGRSLDSFLGRIGVSRKDWDRWVGSKDKLAKIVEIGTNLSLGHFEELGKMQALGILDGDTRMLWNLMKNRHPEKFKDKVEMEHSGEMVFQFDTGVKREIEDDSEDFKEVPMLSEGQNSDVSGSDIL